MKVAKKGGRAKSSKMVTVQCSICGMDMDCPESMLSAERHFCERCTDLLAEGYKPEELKMDKKSLAKYFRRCDDIAEELLDLTFYGFWKKMKDKEISKEELAREFYIHGASSMLGFLISTGMPPPFLDDLKKAIREGKRGMGKMKR